MVDSERVTRLIDGVRRDLQALRSVGERPADSVRADQVALDAVKYRFVTAIEGCAKVAHHLVASEGWGMADTNADAVRLLAGHGVLAKETAEQVAQAVGFRNVLVHRYLDVDDRLVVGQLGRLDDLEDFTRQVAEWVRAQ